MFKIDDDVPIPSRNRYPLAAMRVGQSFFAPTPENSDSNSLQNRITGAAGVCRRNQGWKFQTKQVSEPIEEGGPPVPGVRCWRVE